MAGSGDARGERRGDALPEARQPLVVALGLRLGDARAHRDLGHDLPVQELRAEPLGQLPPTDLARRRRTGARS